MGNFHYAVTLFGLKNIDATYQSRIIVIFYDKLHDYLEDCVDDIVAKSKKFYHHVDDMRKVFT